MELKPILSAMAHRKTGALLIALQVALTLAILANALYVVRDRFDESQRDSGLPEDEVLHAWVIDKERDTTGATVRDDLDALRAIPGVSSASWVNQVPLSNSGNNSGFDIKPDSEDSLAHAATYMTDPDIVRTWGLRLVEGRGFRDDELLFVDENSPTPPLPKGALLSRGMARALFPNEATVVGKTFYWGSTGPIEVIGVVDTLVSPWGRSAWGGDDGSRSVLFAARLMQSSHTYAVRVEPGQLDRVASEVDRMLASRQPRRVLRGVWTMQETRERRYRGEQTMINSLLIVMALLLVMTASGIIGLASLWVNQRRKQIGVRRALGATRRDIVRLFVTENLLITGAGVALGAGLAVALNLAMMDQLELSRLPLGYLGAGAALLLGLGVAAVLGPALRAAAVSPAEATRSI